MRGFIALIDSYHGSVGAGWGSWVRRKGGGVEARERERERDRDRDRDRDRETDRQRQRERQRQRQNSELRTLLHKD